MKKKHRTTILPLKPSIYEERERKNPKYQETVGFQSSFFSGFKQSNPIDN